MDRMEPVCFLMLDLDHFKHVNDTFGHHTGDHVLTDFAQILKDSRRESDLPIRYGGEEFLIILCGADLANARKVAERIQARCERELLLPDGTTNTVSIGVSRHRPGESLHAGVAQADAALYRAKETGCNRVVAET